MFFTHDQVLWVGRSDKWGGVHSYDEDTLANQSSDLQLESVHLEETTPSNRVTSSSPAFRLHTITSCSVRTPSKCFSLVSLHDFPKMATTSMVSALPRGRRPMPAGGSLQGEVCEMVIPFDCRDMTPVCFPFFTPLSSTLTY